ncbi:MAG: hypothetical protein ACR2NX_03415 [Chthoniobacterales bacterium]
MAGKPKQSGVKTSLEPQRESAGEIQAKLLYGERDWRMMRLQELVRERHEPDERLADNHLSARAKANAEIARQKKSYVLLNEVDALWRDLSAQFERAVLDGDADWFERQAKAIQRETRRDMLNQFESEVAHILEIFSWYDRAMPISAAFRQQKDSSSSDAAANRRREKDMLLTGVVISQKSLQKAAARKWRRNLKRKAPGMEDATLESAGKRAPVTAQQVLDCFSSRTEGKRFYVRVRPGEGNFKEHNFKDSRGAREAIRRIARLLGYVMTD